MTTEERKRLLVKCLGMLGSDHAGERDAAALRASTLVRDGGLTWEQVILCGGAPPAAPVRGAPPSWKKDVAICRRHQSLLRPWEQGFVRNLAALPTISSKQQEYLADIAEGLRARGLT